MYIPYALYLDGQVIKVYDAVSHTLAPENDMYGEVEVPAQPAYQHTP